MKLLNILNENVTDIYNENFSKINITDNEKYQSFEVSSLNLDHDYLTIIININFNNSIDCSLTLDLLNSVLHDYVNELKKDPVKYDKIKDIRFSVYYISFWFKNDVFIHTHKHLPDSVSDKLRKPRTFSDVDSGVDDYMSDISPNEIPNFPVDFNETQAQYSKKIDNVYRFLKKGTIDLAYDKSTDKIMLEPQVPFDPDNIEWRTYTYVLPERYHKTLVVTDSPYVNDNKNFLNIIIQPKILFFISRLSYGSSYFHFKEIKSIDDFVDMDTYRSVVSHLFKDVLKEKFKSLGVELDIIF